jgi:ADP-heptose:LPS heptosyltransferase
MVADEFNRLFVGKYAVIHNDVRDQPSRNIYGVDWGKVVERLHDEGFIVIQAGMSPHLPIEGAIDMRTVTVNMLVYLMAGASLFVGIDSGISNIAAAFHVPSVICVGSVNPEYIYPDMSNIEIVNNHPCCEKKYCWNEVVSTTGQDCYIDKNNPPCTNFETDKVINAINQFFE